MRRAFVLAPVVEPCYNKGENAAICRRAGLSGLGGCFRASPMRRGGDLMPTYSDIFQFCLVIIGIINLVVQIINNKRK